LLRETVRYHAEFEEQFKDDRLLGKETYLTFGLSGAGKSTFLARLVGNWPPEVFYDEITKTRPKTENYFMIENVRIGHGDVSTTVVPRGYSIEDKVIFDMPGFSDTSPNRRLQIRFLQQCLVNKIRSAKMLVILKIQFILEDKKWVTLSEIYAKSLKDLFGTSYKTALNSMHFMLTHGDEIEGEREKQLSHTFIYDKLLKAGHSLRESEDVRNLIDRMSESFFVVNYSSMSKKDVLEGVKEMIDHDIANQGENLCVAPPKAFGDQGISDLCERELSEITNQLQEFSKDFIAVNTKIKSNETIQNNLKTERKDIEVFF